MFPVDGIIRTLIIYILTAFMITEGTNLLFYIDTVY
jgi:hypothetical protein